MNERGIYAKTAEQFARDFSLVDVTEEFPFLVTQLSPYYNR
jgi:hypothetical protein